MKMNVSDLVQQARENVGRLDINELRQLGFIPRDGGYFPAVLYPPVTMYPPMGEDEFFRGYEASTLNRFVVYAHIPFCAKRCRFCHFVSFEGRPANEKDTYLDCIDTEMNLYLRRLNLEKIHAEAINIGGGTATCLSPRQLERFLDSFTSRIDFESCEQFTYDVDVSTIIGNVGLERLKLLHTYGVDRITIGVQLLDDGILKDMNRANRGDDVAEAISNARNAGIDNICIDLIYGYPGQTPENWADTMNRVVELDIESFQLYRLRVKPHNQMPGQIADRYLQSPGDFPQLEDVYVMKELGVMIANSAGMYDDYCTGMFSKSRRGVSEYIKKKFCRLYDVVGLGLSANNSLNGTIGIKTQDIKAYCDSINRGQIPLSKGKRCTTDDLLRRSVVGPLRNQFFVDKSFYKENTGLYVSDIFSNKIDALKAHGIMTEDNSKLFLTRRGHFFVDASCIQFYHPDFIPFPESSYADGILTPYNQEVLPVEG
ncbi:MAG: radical SAM protein [Deferrisomatales bacterium]|nr:radical SAM protein [Deferrisomatales bacterium]